ncbi:MAG: NUDIX hydrolase [Bacteroidales bacterium]|nr:NUDIX hydrolase [Bacteroidales bacterium]
MKKGYTYEYERPMITADMVVFRLSKTIAEILLIKRKNEPFKGSWALPGGYMDMGETTESCAVRELEEETSINKTMISKPLFCGYLDQPERDPRGRTVSFVFTAHTWDDIQAKASDDAAEIMWFPTDALPQLAFDHEKAIKMAKEHTEFIFK